MSDAAFKTGALPAYTTFELRKFLAKRDGKPLSEDAAAKMRAEIDRRERVSAGDVSVMTPGERLRYSRALS